MSVHLKIRGKIVPSENVDRWETLPLFNLSGGDRSYGVNLYLKRKKTFLGPPNHIRIGEYLSKEKAERVMTEALEKVIEAERNGGGLVVVV